jgi:sterol desaturase/sphingolipid hydroxylase (fatty acid hydroxylase superfamily)
MRLSRAGYFGDFFVYPPLVGALAITAAWQAGVARWDKAMGLIVVGLAIWTLAEYILHRFVLHHVPFVKDMHEAHHDDQKALIGTPTWVSVVMISATVLVPIWLLVDLPYALALTAGIMLGYLWYVTAHHYVHHWNPQPGSYGYSLKRRHALHHYFDDHGNFGVTSGIWDRVFGTEITVRKQQERRAAEQRSRNF